MKRFVVLLGLALLLVVSTHRVGQAQQTAGGAQAGDDPRFTGKSVTMDGKDLSAARRRFEPGARSAWHSHDKGQLLLAEDGRMRTQETGGPRSEFAAGEGD